jgi:hypothetical protein
MVAVYTREQSSPAQPAETRNRRQIQPYSDDIADIEHHGMQIKAMMESCEDVASLVEKVCPPSHRALHSNAVE